MKLPIDYTKKGPAVQPIPLNPPLLLNYLTSVIYRPQSL